MKLKLEAVIGMFRSRRPRRRLAWCQNQPSFVEALESRLVPTALCDLTPATLQVSALALGETANFHTSIQNSGQGSSKTFKVEYRLSIDATINDQDILLKTVSVKRLTAGHTREWDQSIMVPASVPVGSYYVGIVVDPRHRINESNETNNSLVLANPISVLATSLNGQVQVGHTRRAVSIASVDTLNSPIDPSKVTWLVIHGRNGSPQDVDLVQLADVIDGYQPGDQVLMLDWSKAAASGALGGDGENYIKPVAAWAATTLLNTGFIAKQLNLVGYSWGSYVAAEMAEQLGSVNSILSIEAARDYPGGSYNPEAPGEVDFAGHAEQSWAFFDAADFFGSAATSSTAEEAFLSFGSDHFNAVELVTDILNPPQASPLAPVIPLSRLLTGLPAALWTQKTYDVTGSLVNQGALFDAVIQTTADGQHGESLRYFDGEQEQTVAI